MGEYLSERHIAEFRDAYNLILKSGKDQAINAVNLGLMMKALGMTPTQVELSDMINEVDADGSGDIDFPEFLSMMAQRRKREEALQEIDDTFNLFDRDKDGLISSTELKEVMTAMGEIITDEEIKEIMEEADQSGSSRVQGDSRRYISLEDFRKMFDSLLPSY